MPNATQKRLAILLLSRRWRTTTNNTVDRSTAANTNDDLPNALCDAANEPTPIRSTPMPTTPTSSNSTLVWTTSTTLPTDRRRNRGRRIAPTRCFHANFACSSTTPKCRRLCCRARRFDATDSPRTRCSCGR